MKQALQISLLLVSLGCLLQVCRASPSGSDPWQKADEYLELKEGQSTSVEKYMERVAKRIKELKSFWRPVGPNGREVLEVLQTLQQFKESVETKTCHRTTHDSRKSLTEIVASGKYSRRIKEIVSHYSKIIAEKCRADYSQAYTELVENHTEDKSLKRLQLFFMELIYHTLATGSRDSIVPFQSVDQYISWANSIDTRKLIMKTFIASRFAPINSAKSAEVAYRALESAIGRDQYNPHLSGNVKRTDVDGHQVTTINGAAGAKRVFLRLYYDNCASYIGLTGRPVFERAEADLSFGVVPRMLELEQPGAGEYVLAWAQYNGCLRLMDDSSAREGFLTELGRIADSSTTIRTSP